MRWHHRREHDSHNHETHDHFFGPPPHHHPGTPGPEFGRGGPHHRRGGRHHHGGGDLPPGRLFAPGDLRLLILSLMEDQPRHGYEIIKAIEDSFKGAYAPSPGAVYPILTYLQDQDLIREHEAAPGGKRRYVISDAGKAHLEENRIVLEGILVRVGISAESAAPQGPPEAIIQAMQTLRHALSLKRTGVTPLEIQRISRIILGAAKDIARKDEPEKG